MDENKESILQVQNVSKNYGKRRVLQDVSFSVKNGEKVALIGINGSGKSTLIEIICGVKKTNTGNVFGVENKAYEIGYMPQTFSLFSDLTVKENLQYFALIYNLPQTRVEEILNECYLFEKQNLLAKNLSGGYKQFLALGVAILHKPKLLILDEPTSAMDPIFREDFWEILSKYCQNGGSVLLTTHYMEEVEFCDRVLLLADGKIVLDDNVKNVFEQNEIKNCADLIRKYVDGGGYGK